MIATEIKSPLTNLQLELLKLFAQEVNEGDLLAIRQLIATYFANKAMDIADAVWERDGWTEEKAHKLAHTRLRVANNTEQLHEGNH
jgi:hypothetical protein